MILRDYQQEAVTALWDYFRNGNTGNPIIAMPTGVGKSLVIGGFIQSVYKAFPNQRIMMLTHVKELIEQNFEKLLILWPSAPAGVYSAGVGRRDTTQPTIFAGIQSVAKKPELFGKIDIILIDECHLVSPNMSASYGKFIEGLKKVNPKLKVVGLSATPYRLGLGLLTEGGLFTDIACDQTTLRYFNWFIDQGYIVPLIPKRTKKELSIDGVRLQGGELNSKDLQQAVDKEEITYEAIKETVNLGYDRKRWLVFATGVEHAIHIAGTLQDFGITAVAIHSDLSKEERSSALRRFKSGEIQAIVNNNILTTGFDDPLIDLIVVLRPTASPSLWVQMLGRGTRPVFAPGDYDLTTQEGRLEAIAASHKQNCLVLDFAGNTKRLGPINDPVLPKKKGKGGGSAPVRLCPECGTYMHASIRVCTVCRYTFPVDTKFGFTAGTDELIVSDKPQVEEFKVDKVTYARHKKQGRPDSIRVTYYCGLRPFNTYVGLEHPRYAGKRAREWWREAWPQDNCDVPATTDNALVLVDHLKIPKTIRVWLNKQYPEILHYTYDK